MSERPRDDESTGRDDPGTDDPSAYGPSAYEPIDGTPDPDDVWDDRPAAAKRKREEQESQQAWGSWRQDREANRRKVLRSLVGLVVSVTGAALLAYGCSVLRGPQQVRLADEVSGYLLEPPSEQTQRLAGQFEAAGATGPAAGIYRASPDGRGDVLFVAGFGVDLPVEVLGGLLPPTTTGDARLEGRGGTLTCGATADGSRCLWKGAEIVGGTSAVGVAPEVLEQVTRDLRAGAISS